MLMHTACLFGLRHYPSVIPDERSGDPESHHPMVCTGKDIRHARFRVPAMPARNDGVGLQSYCPNKHIAPGHSLMQGLFSDANYVLIRAVSLILIGA